MGRVGISPSEAPLLAARIGKMPNLILEGLLSHLAEADRLDSGRTFRQLKEFAGLCRKMRAGHRDLRFCHVANSALLMRGETIGNLTRPGIMLYGAPPAPGFPYSPRLRPVMRFVTAVAFLKKVPPGTPLSYGGTFRTTRESLIATLPVGYADGYSRGLSNRSEVLVRGRRAPQAGTVCMDLCLADVSDVPGVQVGDEVVLLGRQGEEEISADELAGHLDTISYEIFCGVSHRVPRFYLSAPTGSGPVGAGGNPGRGR
jgi:alanine racemase